MVKRKRTILKRTMMPILKRTKDGDNYEENKDDNCDDNSNLAAMPMERRQGKRDSQLPPLKNKIIFRTIFLEVNKIFFQVNKIFFEVNKIVSEVNKIVSEVKTECAPTA